MAMTFSVRNFFGWGLRGPFLSRPFVGAVIPSLAASSDLRAAAVALFNAISSHRAAPVID
jgi:hypothetical protein